jgi:hypothetical protein
MFSSLLFGGVGDVRMIDILDDDDVYIYILQCQRFKVLTTK